jgi:hypothetical protein
MAEEDAGVGRPLGGAPIYETSFAEAARMNPARGAITGVVLGVRAEAITEPVMREIRYLDKLVDELARGKAMAKILREQ